MCVQVICMCCSYLLSICVCNLWGVFVGYVICVVCEVCVMYEKCLWEVCDECSMRLVWMCLK